MTGDRAAAIYEEYQRGVSYNAGIGLYDTVKQNEEFYIGNQWNGLNAPDLDKPVLNFLKRVCSYLVAMLVSDDIGVSIRPFISTDENIHRAAVLEAETMRVIERTKAKLKGREILRNCVVDGDGCLFWYFDPIKETGRAAKGEIELDLVDNTRIIFGNPYEQEVERQPYIIIVKREPVSELRARAAEYGVQGEIMPDSYDRYNRLGEGADSELATVLLKLYRRDGSIWFSESTRDLMLRGDTDTGCRLYPVSYMSFDKIKNSYHGRAVITGLIPNQIAVNKLWAMAIRHQQTMAFPKIFYDRQKIGEWSNRVGEAIGVIGNPAEVVTTGFRAGDMSAQLLTIVDSTINYTKEFMGASDAALGNVRPENTSAIIAVQKAAAAPLEVQKMAFYQFVEDYVRIIIDLIGARYGVREVTTPDKGVELFDFSVGKPDCLSVEVEIGASSYWSELMQVQTLDNLFAKGVISDALTYLESLPDRYVPNKKELIKRLSEPAVKEPNNEL